MRELSKLALVVGLNLSLVACGGGGGSDSETTGSNSNNGGTPNSGNSGAQTNLTQEFGKWLTDMSTNHIETGYQSLLDESKTLSDGVASFCANEAASKSDLKILQQQWTTSNQSWQAIQWLKVGPIIEESRNFRFQFWPDSNNAVEKGVDKLVARDETITADYVSSQNVGAQGFPAIEKLLFNPEPANNLINAENKNKQCEVLSAISLNVVNMSEEVVTAWSATGGNYRATFIAGTGEFTGPVDVVEEVVTNWLEQLERVKDEKMLTPLGENAPGLPHEAESYISDTSLNNIKTNIDSLLAIYTASNGHGFDDILNNHLEQTSIASQMLESLTRAQTKINEISGSYDTALNSEESRARLEEVINALRDFRTVLSADFIQAMDINIGFNSNDGD